MINTERYKQLGGTLEPSATNAHARANDVVGGVGREVGCGEVFHLFWPEVLGNFDIIGQGFLFSGLSHVFLGTEAEACRSH